MIVASLGQIVGHGVIAALRERVAAQDAFQPQPYAVQRAVALNGFQRILRAGRVIATGRGRQARDALIQAYRPDQ
jgi:hypothetical protein